MSGRDDRRCKGYRVIPVPSNMSGVASTCLDMIACTQAGAQPVGIVEQVEDRHSLTVERETPAGVTQIDVTQIDETPMDETPMGETPMGETPTGETSTGETTTVNLQMRKITSHFPKRGRVSGVL